MTEERRITDGTTISSNTDLVLALEHVEVVGWLYRGWRFEVECIRGPAGDGWLVHVIFARPDRDTNERGTGRSRPLFVRKGDTAHDVWRTAYRLIALTLEHELHEAFQVAGRRVLDPHRPMVSKEEIA